MTSPAGVREGVWTEDRATEHVLALELFGMRFGLDRMRRLLARLGDPQRAFRAVHVVGTNGKSSTARMTAAILAAHGVRTGTYLSPHLLRYAERIRIGEAELSGPAFGGAVGQVAAAAAWVERYLEPGDRVTQFETLTAAAFVAFAQAGVEVAVVEAGLGGRLDATNVLDAPVVVLTSVGLEHTQWLGSTIAEIAAEKLAVVRPGAVLVTGALAPAARQVVDSVGARVVEVAGPGAGADADFRRVNRAVAAAAARGILGRALDPAVVAGVQAELPGRLQVVSEAPLTVLDGAHNADGMAALAAALPAVVGERPLFAVVSVLDDKDAAGMLDVLLARCTGVVFTTAPTPRALAPSALAAAAGLAPEGTAPAAAAGSGHLEAVLEPDRHAALGAGHLEVVLEPDPHAALARAQAMAGPAGAVLATGSLYLVAALLAGPAGARAASVL
jgi:dihydrofolate synthase/folylpolyglutamate synthase